MIMSVMAVLLKHDFARYISTDVFQQPMKRVHDEDVNEHAQTMFDEVVSALVSDTVFIRVSARFLSQGQSLRLGCVLGFSRW